MTDTSFGRLIGALWSPTATFRAIRERPTWGLPFALLLGISVGASLLLSQKLDVMAMFDEQFAAQGKAVPAGIENNAGLVRGCSFLQGLIGPPIVYLLGAAIFLSLNLWGGTLRYAVSFSVILHAFLPKAIQGLVVLPILWSREAISMKEIQSGGLLQSNLAFLAPPDAPALSVLLGALDFFSLWTVVLLVIGYREGARVSTRKAAGWVLGLWILSVSALAGFALLGTLKGS